LFIDDEYVNYLYFSELLNSTSVEIIQAISLSQAIHWLNSQTEIKIIFISAAFAESFNDSVIRLLKEKYTTIPIIFIEDDLPGRKSKKCHQWERGYFIDRYIDSDHLTETIIDVLESSLLIKHMHC
jgi:response regulator RpfG family c-di-GMP phosphodiesterase